MKHLAPSISLLGYKLNPMTKHEFMKLVTTCLDLRERRIMTHLNLHGMAVMYDSPEMSDLLLRRDVVTTLDGAIIVVLGKLLGVPLSIKQRMTSLDYIDEFFELASDKGWKIFYVGASENVLSAGLAAVRAKHPKLMIDGRHGYFDMSATYSAHELEIIESSRGSDILVVGMGMPRQEKWVCRIEDQVDAPIIITIGAMMEYIAGAIPTPPRFLGPLGLEGVYRLATTPKRSAYRYLVEPVKLLARWLFLGPPKPLSSVREQAEESVFPHHDR